MIRAALWGLLAIALVVSFDHAMRADAANLCSRDDTAFEGC